MVERRVEYDFLTWVSFPSSIKLFNPTVELPNVWVTLFETLAVKPGSKLTVSVWQKVKDVTHEFSYVLIEGFDGSKWSWLTGVPPSGAGGVGTIDWRKYERSITIPSNIVAIRCKLMGAGGLPAITWYDDLKIYQDDVLIYSNDFNNWNPIIGAGLGGIATAIPAYLLTKKPKYALIGLLGALIGAGVGYMTAKP
jgi:hypothetical protein